MSQSASHHFICNYLINHYWKANRNGLGKMLNTNYDEGYFFVFLVCVCLLCVLLGCLVQITHRTMQSAFGWTAYFALTIHKVFEHMHRTINGVRSLGFCFGALQFYTITKFVVTGICGIRTILPRKIPHKYMTYTAR